MENWLKNTKNNSINEKNPLLVSKGFKLMYNNAIHKNTIYKNAFLNSSLTT